MNFIWFFIIVFVVLLAAGCATMFSRTKSPTPEVIIVVTDVNGKEESYALDNVKELKVIVSRKVKYEFEVMVELNEKPPYNWRLNMEKTA